MTMIEVTSGRWLNTGHTVSVEVTSGCWLNTGHIVSVAACQSDTVTPRPYVRLAATDARCVTEFDTLDEAKIEAARITALMNAAAFHRRS
jgi:hypothetical protein